MCRWIAYRGETIPLEQYVTAPAHSLVVQSQRSLESTAATNEWAGAVTYCSSGIVSPR